MNQSRAGVRVIQLSDCHLQSDPARAYRGVNAWDNFVAVWQSASAWRPDIVLLTGDLREDRSTVPYERIARALGNQAVVLALPGNHDEPAAMRQWFPLGPWDGVYSHDAGPWQLVLLDSTKPGRVEGSLDEETVAALREIISSTAANHTLIALHHQPVLVDSPWINRWPLQNPAPFLELVDSEARVRCVLWGHIHQCFEEVRGKARLLGCPSTAANTLTGTRQFRYDERGAGCRWLILEPGGGIETGVIYAAT